MQRPSAQRALHRIRFTRAEDAEAFVRALQRFLSSPRGEPWGRNSETQLWAPGPSDDGTAPVDVYLADDALLATEAAFSPMPAVELCRGLDLPDTSVVLMKGSQLQ